MTKELTQFKYEQLDDSTADFLRDKESNMREIVGKAYTELGRELTEARDRLAGSNQYDGVFEKWFTHLGWKKRTVYELINRHEELVRLSHEQKAVFEELPITLSYAVSAKSSESTPAKAQAKAEVLAGEITTNKAYKERVKEIEQLERERDEAEQQAEIERRERERLEAENEELSNREPEVVTEYVEVNGEDLRDRTLDTPYGTRLLDDFYNAMDELSEWQRKYAWITSDNDQLRRFVSVDEDMKEEFIKNENMWNTLSSIFYGTNDDIEDVEIITIK